MSPIAHSGSGFQPDAAGATKGLLDLAHSALPSSELAGVLAGTARAATRLLEPGAPPPPPRAPSAVALSGSGRAYLSVIEDVLARAAVEHGRDTEGARALHRALDDYADDVAARPRGAAVPLAAGVGALLAAA